jgi:hypothetical protein
MNHVINKIKYAYLIGLSLLIFAIAGCGLLSSPSRTVKLFHKHIENGEITEAMKLMSNRAIKTLGIDKMRKGFENTTREVKAKGGISELNIIKEEIIGELAEVDLEMKFGNGSSRSDKVKLIKEDGDWKIDLSK